MFCIKCGTKNDGDSKFCVSCGAELEENVEEVKEEKKNPVEEVIDARKDKIEESNNSTSTSEIKIDGKPVSVNNNIGQPKSNNKVIIPIIIIVAVIVIGALGVTGYFIYTDFVKRDPASPTEPNNPKGGNETKDAWEFSYTIPEGFKEEEYSDKDLRFFKYKNDTDFCSITLWKVDYIEEGATEESLLRKYSNIDDKYQSEIRATSYPINKIRWTSLKRKDTWNTKTEFGKLNDDKTNFYMILYSDFSPSTRTCETKLQELLSSIKYN